MKELREKSYINNNIQENLQIIQMLLESILLARNSALSRDSSNKDQINAQELPQQQLLLIELEKKTEQILVADIALILGALPINQRKLVWDSIDTVRQGKVLIEMADAVRETLISTMSEKNLISCTAQLNTNEVANLANFLPQSVTRSIFKSFSIEKREQLRSAMSYPPDSIGALMDFNMITIRRESNVEAVLRYLRRSNDLPDHTDQLFVVDRDNLFEGILPLSTLLVNEPESIVANLMTSDIPILHPEDKAEQFAQLFGRNVLVSAPVVDEDGKLLGRVPINAVVSFALNKAEKENLGIAGLLEQEDIYSSVWKSAKNRWIWLSLNLCIALIASRVIGGFEDTLEEYVALAALLPIVASLAISSGNQTKTILIRALAKGQINDRTTNRLLIKELAISLLNGFVWGGIAGGFVLLLYKNLSLAMVLSGTILVNQLLVALVGLFIPLTLQKFGSKPISVGTNVLLTAISTSGGFFIFLGLATIFLAK
jgi:magnesium transporter